MTSPSDTGEHLRGLYASTGGVRGIFSQKVLDYSVSRPDYPAALFDALRAAARLKPGSVVADIGAGTGLLTQGLLAQGYEVWAIEPNASMREAADARLGAMEAYRSAEGTAEAIPLAAGSVDLVTAAQAFHWFEIDKARAECLRVLRPAGQVALIWNDRLVDDSLHRDLDSVFARFGGEKRAALVAHEAHGDIPAFFGASAFSQADWPHEHLLDAAGLQSLVFSRSYMPERGSAQGSIASREVGSIFERHAVNGRVAVRYVTRACIGRPADR